MKLSFEEITDIVAISELSDEDKTKVLNNAKALIAEKEAQKEEEKAAKDKVVWKPVGVVNLATIQKHSKDGLGYILMYPEDADLGDFAKNVNSAINYFNHNLKRKQVKVSTLGEAFEAIPAKIWKKYNIKVKTKESVYFDSFENINSAE